MWRLLRISILLIVLATVAKQTFQDQVDLEWKDNFYVALYPVNADGSEKTENYIKTLSHDDFNEIETYFQNEATHYGVNLRRPIAIQLGNVVGDMPPPPPTNGSVIKTMLWSLSFRLFAWNNSPKVAVPPDIKLYLLFYDPQKHDVLAHSTALNKGRIGRVNLFGGKSYAQQNLVITAHELLHTLKATDKYNLVTGLPIFPEGYAEPDLEPRYPQKFAELMGGYVPISENKKKIPKNLNQTVIGRQTAKEIGWVK